MKNLKICLYLAVVISIMTSCGSLTTLTKDVKYMGIRFRPLAKTDFKLVGDFKSETTVSGKMGPYGKKLDKKFAKNYNKGLQQISVTQATYFVPEKGEVITGALYSDEAFGAVYTPAIPGKSGFFAKNKLVVAPDPALDFAYYDMVAKHADVDYFINVRFDRKLVVKGKNFTETVTVKADGIKLVTD